MVWVGGIAAEDAVVAQHPEVSRLGERFVREGRDIVRVGEAALLVEGVEELLELTLLEAEVLGRAVAHVAGVDRPVGRGQHRAPPEEVRVLLDGSAEVLEALVADGTGVPEGRLEPRERDCFDLDHERQPPKKKRRHPA
jgi:hypothetical protein